MATKTKNKTTFAGIKLPHSSASKAPVKKIAAKKVAKKAPVKKALVKKVPVKVGGPIKEDSAPTAEQKLKRQSKTILELSDAYSKLVWEYVDLKRSFSMVKENYEREKNRLDKVIDASLNNSKALEAITNTAPIDSDSEEASTWNFEQGLTK